MEKLYEFFNRKIKDTPLDFIRYKYDVCIGRQFVFHQQ